MSRFLVDAHPSHLYPPSGPVENALYRARLDWFVDAFFQKAVPQIWAGIGATIDEDRDKAAEALIEAVAKEIEPRLEAGKGPFFGGSETLTFAEVRGKKKEEEI